MPGEYSRRQRAGKWPRKGKWSPQTLPDWYLTVLSGLASDLTRWRREHDHDPGQELDPRADPRHDGSGVEERSRHADY